MSDTPSEMARRAAQEQAVARRKKFLYHYQSKLRLAESEADIMWLFAQAYDELYEEHLLRKRD